MNARVAVFFAAAVLSSLVAAAGIGCRDKRAPNVVAIVDGAEITEAQVRVAAKRTFGEELARDLNPDVRAKLIKSVVASKVIANASEREMSPAELEQLERKVIAHRDERLAREFIEQHVDAVVVSPESVADFYRAHPERFGEKREVTFELIEGTDDSAGQRARLLSAFAKVKAVDGFQQLASQLNDAGHSVNYRAGHLPGDDLVAEVASVVNSAVAGEAPSVLLARGRATVVKVTAVRMLAAPPLASVYDVIAQELRRESQQALLKRATVIAREQLQQVPTP